MCLATRSHGEHEFEGPSGAPSFCPAILWGMPDRSRKRPSDPNELAKQLVDEVAGDAPPFNPDEGKDPAAVALGRKGGLKGGKARAAKMTPEQRSAAARRAAKARWARTKDGATE
jgi:hypothetical protein